VKSGSVSTQIHNETHLVVDVHHVEASGKRMGKWMGA
jgi:hypothetical protein